MAPFFIYGRTGNGKIAEEYAAFIHHLSCSLQLNNLPGYNMLHIKL